ncbi:GNAT family N-acetyltransferase [Ottowia sp.]|uniref:GNAT family N-acetyltransferase n=1 Tax=Ottowia sp. TaxID=1898956 RepID=UPI0025D59101|nr:GNAT family N-acetyltransferase [Ottowia sp.]MBK6745768.1 GNAT family N-acetyltransferase [Ottowia sp.]
MFECEEAPLDPTLHDRAGFDCGVPELNDDLQRYADQHRRRGITSVFVLTPPGEPSRILGYYTLSAAEVDAAGLGEADRKKLPRYPVPCFRMGRLACRGDQRGLGLGRLLLGCAVDRGLKASEQVAASALLVDAKNDVAKAFYQHHGFRAFAGQPLTLYLPLQKSR